MAQDPVGGTGTGRLVDSCRVQLEEEAGYDHIPAWPIFVLAAVDTVTEAPGPAVVVQQERLPMVIVKRAV